MVGGLDDLESYLSSAPISGVQELPNQTYHRGQHRVLFAGGVSAHAKPANGLDEYIVPTTGQPLDGAQAIRNEVAAWRAARALGWLDLVPAAVLRVLPNANAPESGEIECSVQVIHHDVQEDVQVNFTNEDVIRAAIFDFLVFQPDRNQRNWLVTGREFSYNRRPVLIDHSFAFNFDPRPVRSYFFRQRAGTFLPQWSLEAVRLLADRLEKLEGLLSPTAIEAVANRAQLLLDGRRLPFEGEVGA